MECTPNKVIVVFTEGATDEVFFKRLIPIIEPNKHPSCEVVIKNLKGIGNYAPKAPALLKNQIKPEYSEHQIMVFCTYDLDVFFSDFQEKPPVDWALVNKKLEEFGAHKVHHIKADKMIEDWFLADLDGLCSFLGIKKPKSLPGKNGYEKIKGLFKKGNRVYQKGYNTGNFVEKLDINVIYKRYESQFEKLKEELG